MNFCAAMREGVMKTIMIRNKYILLERRKRKVYKKDEKKGGSENGNGNGKWKWVIKNYSK